jgi:hypothetical protein
MVPSGKYTKNPKANRKSSLPEGISRFSEWLEFGQDMNGISWISV